MRAKLSHLLVVVVLLLPVNRWTEVVLPWWHFWKFRSTSSGRRRRSRRRLVAVGYARTSQNRKPGSLL